MTLNKSITFSVITIPATRHSAINSAGGLACFPITFFDDVK